MPHQSDSFGFLENSTAQALLGTASAATVGPGFLSEILGAASSAPQLFGESLRKLSIGNTLTDSFNDVQKQFQIQEQLRQRPDVSQQSAPQLVEDQRSQQPSGSDIDASIATLDTPAKVSAAIDRLREGGELTPALSEKLLAQLEVVRGR